MSDTNGDGSTHGGNSLVRLRKLLAYHEHAADAIRTTLALLNGEATVTKQQRAAHVLGDALALDRQRRTTKKPTDWSKTARRKQRKATAALLARLSRTTPRPLPTGAFGGLFRHGYIKAKEGGYVLTDKVFTP